MTTPTLAPIAARALAVAERPVPVPLQDLASKIAAHFPDEGGTIPFGNYVGSLAEAFRAKIYRA